MEKEPRGKYYPRPSSAGPERCIRQMVYHAMGTPEDKAIADRFIMTMDDSSFHEVLTHDWLQKTAYKLHSSQMKISLKKNGFSLKGSIDGIITDLLNKDRLFEHKALNHFAFEKYWQGEWPLDYFAQSTLYLCGLKELLPEIDEIILLIKNKNTAQYIDFVLRYDFKADILRVLEVEHSSGQKRIGEPYLFEMSGVVADAIKKFQDVDNYVIKNTLPDRPFEIGTQFPCAYCSWEKTCFKDYEKEYNALSDDVLLEGEIEDLARYYLEVHGHIQEMEKEKEALKIKIKAIFHEKGIHRGKAGIYLLHNQLQKRTLLNKDLIPADILNKASEVKASEVLTIRKIKTEEII